MSTLVSRSKKSETKPFPLLESMVQKVLSIRLLKRGYGTMPLPRDDR